MKNKGLPKGQRMHFSNAFFGLKDYLAAIKNVFLPKLCFTCERKVPYGYLCESCLSQIEFIYPPLCRLCSSQLKSKKNICAKCAKTAHPYEKLICVTKYKGPVVDLIHLFKYQNYDFLTDLFGSLMTKHLTRLGFSALGYDFITAVPLYPSKLRDRGYNQANLLAQYLAKYFKISLKDDIIYATRESPSQTKLDKISRLQNIKGSFKVNRGLEGKKIILIDDIFTTGSTVKECARKLKEKGAAVTVITFSKT